MTVVVWFYYITLNQKRFGIAIRTVLARSSSANHGVKSLAPPCSLWQFFHFFLHGDANGLKEELDRRAENWNTRHFFEFGDIQKA
jgi:hypothetical protein